MKKEGIVRQIIGPVIDCKFEDHFVPNLKSAIYFELNGQTDVAEVAGHLGDGIVRCISMAATEGLQRGVKVHTENMPIQAPVGEEVLGRMFNVIGKPIDGKGDNFDNKSSIHANPPGFDEQSEEVEMLETGIKVVDLICPYLKGGKIGLFGGAGVG